MRLNVLSCVISVYGGCGLVCCLDCKALVKTVERGKFVP